MVFSNWFARSPRLMPSIFDLFFVLNVVSLTLARDGGVQAAGQDGDLVRGAQAGDLGD